MKKKFAKTLSIALCAALLTGAAGSAVYAGSGSEAPGQIMSASVKGASVKNPGSDGEVAKDETVYVLAGADGSVQKIIVSDWLKNAAGAASISDNGELEGVEALKAGESYTMSGDARIWDAGGGDVYYQGTADQELPVRLSVSYRLDGREISPEELAGKSGKVTIRFDYENTQYETVEIGGRMEKIYIPFAMMTGIILDDEAFSNVEVTNGRLVNDGSRTIVAGIAFPGLQENLGLDEDQLEIPDYVEITADVQGFRMTNTVTIAANSLFNSLDTGELDSAGDLTGSLGQLADAMGQLMDGSSALYDGLCTLLDKSGELIQGINALAEGAGQLQSGAGELYSGAAALSEGAGTLAGGLSQLDGNSAALQAGSRQVFDSLLAMADSQLAAAGLSVPQLTPENYGEVLDGVIASLDKDGLTKQVQETARKKVTQAVNENWGTIRSAVTDAVETEVSGKVWAAVREQVTAQVTAGVRENVQAQVAAAVQAQVMAQVTAVVREQVEAGVLAAMGMTKEQYDAGVAAGIVTETQQAQVSAAIESQMAGMQDVIAAKTAEQMASAEIQATVAAKTEETMQTSDVQATIQALIAQNMEADTTKALARQKTAEQMASTEVQSIITEKSLEQEDLLIAENMGSPEVQEQIAQGLAQAESGLAAIAALKGQLDSYNAFYTGLAQYTAGVSSAKKGAEALQEGAASLRQGAGALNEGMDTLYNGILTLKNGAPALADGVTQLRDGALRLSDGLEELNEKGIQKLLDAAEGDLAGLAERIKATVEVSKNYESFSGLPEGMEGKVKFVYRTEAVE